MSGIATAIGVGAASIGGAAIKAHASKKASKAQVKAEQDAAAARTAAQAQITAQQQPFIDTAAPAINALTKVNSGDYSGFNQSPDYLYARDQALQGVQSGAAARGGLYSGNAGRRLEEVASGLASQNLGNYRNSLFNQIGVGQNATNVLSQSTANTAAGVAGNLIGAGDARASGIVGAGNAWGGAVQDLGSIAGDFYGNSLMKKKPAPIGLPYKGTIPAAWSYNSIMRGG